MKKDNLLKSLTALTLVFGLTACVDPTLPSSGNSSDTTGQSTPSETSSPSVHEHTFATEWSKDETDHWHASTCGHDDTVSKIQHDWDDGVITTDPTEDSEGVKTFTCNTCKKTKTETVAQLTHTHKFADEWSKDETDHWHASTCGHDDTVSKIQHSWDNGTNSAIVNGVYTTTFTCDECGQTKTTTTDTKVYTHDDWTQVGEPKSYYFDNDAIYSLNEENIGDGTAHFDYNSHDYLINNTSLGANYTVSVDLKGTYETDVDVEMDAGLVAWYQDNDNYVVIGVKWANWDRPHEIRSIFMNAKINGETSAADIWTDGNGTYPADGATLTVTKTGKKYDVALTGCYLGYSKTGSLVINGTDTETAKAGLYAANDLVEFKNYNAESFEVSSATVYNATIDGVANALSLDSKDNTFTLTANGVVSSGTYTANGRNITLSFTDGSVKYAKVYETNGSFEFYTPETPDDNAIIVDGSSSKQTSTIRENMTGDYSMTFDYMGTYTESGYAVKVGFDAWYVDENNYIEVYIEWSAGDRPHEIREIQVTGNINGQNVGWNDIWCDGSNKLVGDGGKLEVVKTGNTFAVKLVSGSYTKEGSATIAALDTSLAYSTRFYAEGDTVSFSNVNMYQDISANYNVSGDGADSAVLRDTGIILTNALAVTQATRTGDFTLSFDYMGTVNESGHGIIVGCYPWYVDENNYIEVYIEWSAGERSHEIREIQVTGNINGQHVGWNDIWCDGSNKLVGDGGKLEIVKSGNTFTVKLVSGSYTKEGSATIAALDTSLAYSTGFYTEGDTVTFSNVTFA